MPMAARETYVMRNGCLVPKQQVLGTSARQGPHLIRDIEPYRSVALDRATGRRAVIGGRAQHREFLRRNDYIEVGNTFVAPRRDELSRADRIADIRGALRD
jgi:hypothetical protein